MKKIKKYIEFEFAVEGMTEAQAEILMKVILTVVEIMGLNLGGGYHETSDADYPEEEGENV